MENNDDTFVKTMRNYERWISAAVDISELVRVGLISPPNHTRVELSLRWPDIVDVVWNGEVIGELRNDYTAEVMKVTSQEGSLPAYIMENPGGLRVLIFGHGFSEELMEESVVEAEEYIAAANGYRQLPPQA